VELAGYGERAADELREVLAAHDQAIARLARHTGATGPFVLGTIENLVDPVLPNLLAVIREHVGARALQLRVDRSAQLAAGLGRREIDAAIVLDPGDVADARELGLLTLRWFVAAGMRVPEQLPEALPLVAYDAPCSMRDLAIARVRELGSTPVMTAESPHLSGVQAAARNGLGYTLLAAGGDGLRAIGHGPLADPIETRLWLLLAPEHAALAEPLRAALAGYNGVAAQRRGLDPALALEVDPEADRRGDQQSDPEHPERPVGIDDVVGQEGEVLTEEAGQERQREEDGGDDRQLLVDLALAVGNR
jgi:DNA-binding transcriptional LysR family regulator